MKGDEMYALFLTTVVAVLVLLIYAGVRCAMFLRNRSSANQLSLITAVCAVLLFVPALWMISVLNRRGLPIPKPGMPDPASGEAVMFALFAGVTAYLAAWGLVRIGKRFLA